MRDLGALDGPLLLFGGPYGNLQATEALRAEAARLGIGPERVICTGDLTAYCGDPAATVALIRDWGVAVVMGNCEENLATFSPECGCGFEEGNACDLLARSWWAHVDAEIGAEDRAWMSSLPRRLGFSLNGIDFAVVHGGATAIARFIHASDPDAVFLSECAAAGRRAVIAGHSGLPFTRSGRDWLWHNPGVIGLPANDGTPRVWFSLLRPGRAPGEIVIEPRPLAYGHRAAAARIRAVGLPEAYAASLSSGLWPSLDQLPATERSGTGASIYLEPCRHAFT